MLSYVYFLSSSVWLWDFFMVKAQGNMNPEALKILNNFDTIVNDYPYLNDDQQKVLRTVLLMNAIRTNVNDVELLTPTYENIDLAFAGCPNWNIGKCQSIAKAMVDSGSNLQPVLFEQPMQNGQMYLIPKATGGVDISELKQRISSQITLQSLIDQVEFKKIFEVPKCHFTLDILAVKTLTGGIRQARNNALAHPHCYIVCVILAITDEERTTAHQTINLEIKQELPPNLLLLDATTNTFQTYLESYTRDFAYSKYYSKSNRQQSEHFSQCAINQLKDWAEHVRDGELRLYDYENVNGITRFGYAQILDLLKNFNYKMYPYGIDDFTNILTLFNRSNIRQGAEAGLTQNNKGMFNIDLKPFKGAWKVEGKYWENATNPNLPIIKLKQEVEKFATESFAKNGQVVIIELLRHLAEPPFGITSSNIAAFVVGFLLKEYATDQYFWSNGVTRPMNVERMKDAIKNAMDQLAMPKNNFKEEAIVTMSAELRTFLEGTATIFHVKKEQCGNVDDASNIIRLGLKKFEFPLYFINNILANVQVSTDTAVISEVIEQYMGIANINNYTAKSTESNLASQIGNKMQSYPQLIADLTQLFTSQNCREGIKAYLATYRGGELPQLASQIKDNGNYITELNKKFNSTVEANWVWSPTTADGKIDETILDYQIIVQSNTIIAPANTFQNCIRSWLERINNFKVSLDAMSISKVHTELNDLLSILYHIQQNKNINEHKKASFLALLQEKKNDFIYLYNHQEEVFRQLARNWLEDLNDDDITEIFQSLPTGVFGDESSRFFSQIEQVINNYKDAQRSNRLQKLWQEKTNTTSPKDWSQQYATPILCMFADNERQIAKDNFAILQKSKPSAEEFASAQNWLTKGTFYANLASANARDQNFKTYVIGDYAYLLPDITEVRKTLLQKLSYIHPYEWLDNSTVQAKIHDMANMQYNTKGVSVVQDALKELSIDELQAYVRELIKNDMTVGIAILKRLKH